MSGSIGWGREDDADGGGGGDVVGVGVDWMKWVRSEVSGHASDTGVWCDPLAVEWIDSGQLSSCLSRPMQDADSHGANKSEDVRVVLAEVAALYFTALQVETLCCCYASNALLCCRFLWNTWLFLSITGLSFVSQLVCTILDIPLFCFSSHVYFSCIADILSFLFPPVEGFIVSLLPCFF